MIFTKEVSSGSLENEIYDLNRQGYYVSKSERYGNKFILFFSEKNESEKKFELKRRTLTLENNDILISSKGKKTKGRFEKFFRKIFTLAAH